MVGAALLVVFGTAPAAAQADVDIGGILRTEFHATTQLDWRDFDAPGPSGIDLRRARLAVKGAAFDRVEYEVERDFREADAPWRDAYLNVPFGRALEIRAGRFKVPFGLEALDDPLKPYSNEQFEDAVDEVRYFARARGDIVRAFLRQLSQASD